MFVQRIQDFEQIQPYSADWDQRSGNIPFRSYTWLSTWWNAYGADHSLYLVAVFDKSPEEASRQLVGLAPFYLEQNVTKGATLRLLGTGEVCSDYLSLICYPEDAEGVCEAVADFLVEHSAEAEHQWDLLELENIESGDLNINRLVEKLWDQSCAVDRSDALNCWRLELPQTWEDFEATQSKSHRKQVRRFVRRVLDTERAELQVCNSAEQIESELDVLIDLHMRRRNSLGQPGCFASDSFDAFIKEVAPAMMEQDACEIIQLLLDDQPVAAEIHFLGGSIPFAYQAGVDPDRLDEQPGSLMQAAVIRHAIERGQIAMDFLRGDEPYKAHWRAVPRECTTIRIVPNRASSQLRNGIWMAGKQMKNLIKTGMSLTGMQ